MQYMSMVSGEKKAAKERKQRMYDDEYLEGDSDEEDDRYLPHRSIDVQDLPLRTHRRSDDRRRDRSRSRERDRKSGSSRKEEKKPEKKEIGRAHV